MQTMLNVGAAVFALATGLLVEWGALPQPLVWYALLVVLIAGIYGGFALIDGRLSLIGIEGIVGLGFMAVAAAGLLVAPAFVGVGLVLHGCWDFVHHPRAVTTRLPAWYPPACAVYDWVLGAFFFWQLANGRFA